MECVVEAFAHGYDGIHRRMNRAKSDRSAEMRGSPKVFGCAIEPYDLISVDFQSIKSV
jgi:hypothetical protein